MLADFGWTMMFKSGVATGTIDGTNPYYSPQMRKAIEEEKGNWKTVECSKNDVFALGLVFLQVCNKLDTLK